MAVSTTTGAAPGARRAAGGSEHHPEIDWLAAERSPEFRELIRRRRAFVVPALGFVFVWYFGFIALAGYAPDFMGERLVKGLTVGYALALTQFVMTWGLAWWYLRRSDRVFDPLARAAAEQAMKASDRAEAERGGTRRFDPTQAERAQAERRAIDEQARQR